MTMDFKQTIRQKLVINLIQSLVIRLLLSLFHRKTVVLMIETWYKGAVNDGAARELPADVHELVIEMATDVRREFLGMIGEK